jgi:TetR/AcrR family transcriptional repressor of nem operon
MSKREALVEATKTLLWERGFYAMSPRDVLKQSGAGQGSLYHFFESKEALASEALAAVAEEVSHRLEATTQSGEVRGAALLRAFLMSERDALRGCRLGRMAQEPDLPDSLRRIVAGGFERLRVVLENAIREAQRDGDLNPALDVRATSECMIAVVQGGYVLARAQDSQEVMTHVASALWSILSVSKPPRERRASASKPSRRPPRSPNDPNRKERHGRKSSRLRKTT